MPNLIPNALAAEISAAMDPGLLYPAARKPSPPASWTACTNFVVDVPPAIGAAINGVPNRN
ncbi:hypothetical protein NtRootA4_25390 [Arthrobacter sp. NtRootA4]|nr:hypothetical protein NtRootA4_25390 [Arthrobacter sp. NtRootA4]BCW23895.1 hypothetical protein NtRootC7_27620 [Arthrobacter sp. NtRootC7]